MKVGLCRICYRRDHHTSICRNRHDKSDKNDKTTIKKLKASTKQPESTSKDKTFKASKVKAVKVDPTKYEDCLTNQIRKVESGAAILAGQAKLLNTTHEREEIVEVILNTGSDHSFITNILAERLRLQDCERIDLNIQTFNTKPLKKECGITKIRLNEIYGEEHEVVVTKIDTIMQSLGRYDFDQKDREFLIHHDIKLSINPDSNVIVPQLILGCKGSLTLLDDRSRANKRCPQ
ncbi:hypothetical protein KIN20_015993 [Parelaphostrongylus tenuis]|uniref:Peptidase aspartic putative domain-containing protein n=1 Tax=Parelaphostrongylus tenuis TaxID=148309 RepID=A0AAD5QQD1_PARTN|nr:hypothetical protein KIN20_015993 [Parelaphostrongylus tenuis]